MTTIIPGVHYTVDLYEWGISAYDYSGSLNFTDDAWNKLSPGTKSRTVSVNSAILVDVRVYEDSTNRAIDNGLGMNVTTTNGRVYNVSDDGTTKSAGLNDHWVFIINPGTPNTPTKIDPSQFTVRFDPNSSIAVTLNGGPYTGYGDVNPSSNVFPITITWTGALNTPFPSTIQDFLGSSIKQKVFNTNTKTWIVVADVAGVFFTYTFPGPYWSKPYSAPASSSVGKYTVTSYKTYSAATAAANKLIIIGKSTTYKPSPGSGSTNTTGNTGVDADKGMSGDQWNPPPHLNTKGVRFTDVLESQAGGNIDWVTGKPMSVATLEAYNNSQMGRMYQDTYLLSAKNPEKKLWGFKFMYNPTSISYSTNTDTSNDWTLGKADPSNALGGNTAVSFELYLNRVIDVKAINAGKGGSGYPGKPLSPTALKGIKTRGTEYDLEYLYRVVNGDPQPNQALLADKGKSSDLGFITGMPFWLHINDNMRYFGSLASLSVNHVIFTEDMIPVFTTVDVTFIRYPATATTVTNAQAKKLLNAQAGGTTTAGGQ
jgi:hypothetical protein